MDRLARVPLFVILMGIGAASMLVPAVYAGLTDDNYTGRVFLYCAVLTGVLTGLIALAMANYAPQSIARSQLLALLSAFTILPVMLAWPFYEAVGTTSFLNAWFEMVSAITTTGATLFDRPDRLTDAVHLWRALVGWMGGFLMWVAAVSIFAPMNLGGFEIRARAPDGTARFGQISDTQNPAQRMARFAGKLLPIYAGLTAVLWLGLTIAGDRPFVAICHAMSTLATSGISPIGGLQESGAGRAGEVLIFGFLVFALSRLTFSQGILGEDRGTLRTDPEIRLGLGLVLVVPLLLFLRHFIGAQGDDAGDSLGAALAALWGGLFTVMSFLTTTGWGVETWESARAWSGLETPGLVLLGLALVGGGVATTAGGVKLLRIYALYKHGKREIDNLIYPSMVGGSGPLARHIRRQGAHIAWIFFMLFALTIAATMAALALTGMQFEVNIVLTIAALSNTGPLAGLAGEVPIFYATVPEPAKPILAAAMVLGRLEALAIIALFNPDFWRN